jgi:hypothetical protein
MRPHRLFNLRERLEEHLFGQGWGRIAAKPCCGCWTSPERYSREGKRQKPKLLLALRLLFSEHDQRLDDKGQFQLGLDFS